MPDQAAVLFANDAFYLAFATKDIAAMDQVWATNTPVTCIHPGWDMTAGRNAVMESWRDILASPNAPEIRSHNASVSVIGDTAYVVCTEILEDKGFLIATNIFVREGSLWKMVHHQAGAVPPPSKETLSSEPEPMQ